jgi:hypothetical protein
MMDEDENVGISRSYLYSKGSNMNTISQDHLLNTSLFHKTSGIVGSHTNLDHSSSMLMTGGTNNYLNAIGNQSLNTIGVKSIQLNQKWAPS